METDQAQDVTTVRVARRVYVGNLPWKTSWQDLKDHFRSAGHGVFFTPRLFLFLFPSFPPGARGKLSCEWSLPMGKC